jgi:antitoxin (DNA-binding transcriptional repressor) of toxin-antitoxin stability system
MSTASAFERSVTSRDLKHSWSDIVHDLRAGQKFTVYHDDQPLAHLHPLPSALLHKQDTDLKPFLLYSPLILLFGHVDLARMLGLTEPTWRAQLSTGEISTPVTGRLRLLVSWLETLRTFLPPFQLRRWFRRARRELNGQSAIDHLSFPWTQGDARAALIQALVESALYDAAPSRPPR